MGAKRDPTDEPASVLLERIRAEQQSTAAARNGTPKQNRLRVKSDRRK